MKTIEDLYLGKISPCENMIRENGDIEKKDLLEKSPFDNYDFLTLFGTNIPILTEIVNTMHNTITAA